MFWQRYLDLCNEIDKFPNAVAAEVGVKSTGTVTGWKHGAKPRPTVLNRLAEYFGVSVDYLMGHTDEKAAKNASGVPGSEKEPAAQGDGFSEFDKELLKFFHAQSPEKIRAFLTLGGAPTSLLDAFDRAQDGEE